MSIIRFDPFADLLTDGRWVPAVDIFENGKQELVLKAELPDMKREDIQVVFENNTLTLKGERKFDGDVKQEQFHRVERAYGTFSRSFSLPSTVDAHADCRRIQERRADREASVSGGSRGPGRSTSKSPRNDGAFSLSGNEFCREI